MKFIGGIHDFKIENGQIELNIPKYHRAAIGLITGTKVYVYPRKTENQVPNSDRVLDIREVIISLFHPKKWNYVWKLEISAIDRPGLTRKITQVLKEIKANIFIQESLIANYNQNFTVSIIADFEKYFRSIEENNGGKIANVSTKDIFDTIKNEFTTKTSEDDFGINVEKFEPIKFLTNISENELINETITGKSNNLKSKNLISKEKLMNYYENANLLPVDKLGITLERHLLSVLDIFEYADSSYSTIQGTLFSDTEEKYIIVRFFSSTQLVAHLEVIHKNHVGAINAFTEAINETHNEYNIISCYNRIEDDTNFAHWHVLIDVTRSPEKLPSLIKKINDIQDISNIEVKPISYSKSLLNEGIGRLPESLRQRQDKMKSSGKQKNEELSSLPLIRMILEQKENHLRTKEEHFRTYELLSEKIQYDINIKKRQNNFVLCFVPLGYIMILISLTLWLTFGVMEAWITFLGIVGAFISYLYFVISGQSINPKKYFDDRNEKYKNEIYRQNNYREDTLSKLQTEIDSLKNEIDVLEKKNSSLVINNL